MPHFTSQALLLSLCLFAHLALAASVTVSEKRLNAQLALGFPIDRSYKGVSATFSEPSVILNVLDKTIQIKTLITASANGESLSATGVLAGKIEFDPVFQVLKYVKPRLEEFHIISDKMQNSKPTIRAIKQSISTNLSDIILVDFEQLELLFPRTIPAEIDIRPRGIVMQL